MSIAVKVAALLEMLTTADVEAMAPAERERFAHLLSRWANVARIEASGVWDRSAWPSEPADPPPGVLSALAERTDPE